MKTEPVLTPLQTRYVAKKATLPASTLLAVNLGDFYELFFEDAKIAAPVLGIALTKRSGSPMCGFPVHSQHRHLQALANAGIEILLCPSL